MRLEPDLPFGLYSVNLGGSSYCTVRSTSIAAVIFMHVVVATAGVPPVVPPPVVVPPVVPPVRQ